MNVRARKHSFQARAHKKYDELYRRQGKGIPLKETACRTSLREEIRANGNMYVEAQKHNFRTRTQQEIRRTRSRAVKKNLNQGASLPD